MSLRIKLGHPSKENKMTHQLRKLGLALMAVVALGAVAASSASATEFTSADGTYPVSFHGEQSATAPLVFLMDKQGFTTECESATFAGGLTEKSSTILTSTVIYAECISAGSPGLEATIAMNGCNYQFHLPASGGQATADIVCPAGKEITISVGFGACVTHIPPQTGLSHVTFSNDTATSLHAEMTLTGMKATLTDVSAFLCPFNGTTSVSDGEYKGTLTLKLSKEGHIG
jgi:hypothetical protein